MNFDVYDLSAKVLMGEELSDEEKKMLRDYDTKYKLVRYIVMEKRRYDGVDMVDFQFTPGDGFLDMSALDVANSIIKSFSALSEPLDFGDGSMVRDSEGKPIKGVYGNPPHTGRAKKSITES